MKVKPPIIIRFLQLLKTPRRRREYHQLIRHRGAPSNPKVHQQHFPRLAVTWLAEFAFFPRRLLALTRPDRDQVAAADSILRIHQEHETITLSHLWTAAEDKTSAATIRLLDK